MTKSGRRKTCNERLKRWRLVKAEVSLTDANVGAMQNKPAQRVWIPKLGSKELRPLGIPPVENRVVEMALRNVLEPIFEHGFAEHSYGFRPGKSAKDALRRVEELLEAGNIWVVDADLKGYF